MENKQLILTEEGQYKEVGAYQRDLGKVTDKERIMLLLIDDNMVQHRTNQGLPLSVMAKRFSRTERGQKVWITNNKRHSIALIKSLVRKNYLLIHKSEGSQYVIFNPIYTWPKRPDQVKHLDKITFLGDTDMQEYCVTEWLKLSIGSQVFDLNIYGKGATVNMEDVTTQNSFFDMKASLYFGANQDFVYSFSSDGLLKLDQLRSGKAGTVYKVERKELDNMLVQSLDKLRSIVYFAYEPELIAQELNE